MPIFPTPDHHQSFIIIIIIILFKKNSAWEILDLFNFWVFF